MKFGATISAKLRAKLTALRVTVVYSPLPSLQFTLETLLKTGGTEGNEGSAGRIKLSERGNLRIFCVSLLKRNY